MKEPELTNEQVNFLKEITDKAQEGNKDTREIILDRLAGYAYGDDKLYQLTRFTSARAEGILKNHIVNEFFQIYYSKCKAKFHFKTVKIKTACICKDIKLNYCKFCESKGYFYDSQYKVEVDKELFSKEDIKELLDMSPELLKTCMKMYIGDNGLGRKEMFEFLKALDRQVEQGMFGKMGNFLGGGGIRT